MPVVVCKPPSRLCAKAWYERKARECPSTNIRVGFVVSFTVFFLVGLSVSILQVFGGVWVCLFGDFLTADERR